MSSPGRDASRSTTFARAALTLIFALGSFAYAEGPPRTFAVISARRSTHLQLFRSRNTRLRTVGRHPMPLPPTARRGTAPARHSLP